MLKLDELNRLENPGTIYLTIIAPKHGGLVIYESAGDSESAAVFGGNLEEATTYFKGRAEELQKRDSPDASIFEIAASARRAQNGAAM